ncbi:MAG: CapA family protein [Anaerolineae bacterium]|nr:CapA family protein [Anaerolineae bacterium]
MKEALRRLICLIVLPLLGLIAALVVACGSVAVPEVTPTPTRTPRKTATPVPSPTPTPTLTPTPAWPVSLFVPPGLPPAFARAIGELLENHSDLFIPASAPEDADIELKLSPDPENVLLGGWTYALVAPFPTLTDDVAWSDVLSCWQGNPSGPFAGRPLLMSPETAMTLAVLLGEPAPGAIELLPAGELLPRAWETRPSWGIVPFEQLEPRWKVLYIDGVSPLDRRLEAEPYPLTVRIGASGLERGVLRLEEALGGYLTNRDVNKMSVVVMTGVTALTRATAMRMNRNGITYPAEDIHSWLLDADITHISNEVSFAEDCPPPGDYYTMVFCSDPDYIQLLEEIDVDVVELTGNHLLDWGVEAMQLSLRMYEERGIPYYGGGWNVEQALRPVTLTHGVHTFGFLGCNPAGPRSDWATEELPGSAPCNFGYIAEQLGPQIRALRERGIIPIVTLQYLETYSYEPTGQQRADFRALAEAGAAIVSGSQAHQPQGFDFVNGTFIHYGLGNLFFDQMQSLETRQQFIDRHVFYDGRHISTELLTAMLEDYSRPRPMTQQERAALLSAAFAASGW